MDAPLGRAALSRAAGDDGAEAAAFAQLPQDADVVGARSGRNGAPVPQSTVDVEQVLLRRAHGGVLSGTHVWNTPLEHTVWTDEPAERGRRSRPAARAPSAWDGPGPEVASIDGGRQTGRAVSVAGCTMAA